MRITHVLHGEFQLQLSNEFDKLFGISVGEWHIVHVEDEEDG